LFVSAVIQRILLLLSPLFVLKEIQLEPSKTDNPLHIPKYCVPSGEEDRAIVPVAAQIRKTVIGFNHLIYNVLLIFYKIDRSAMFNPVSENLFGQD